MKILLLLLGFLDLNAAIILIAMAFGADVPLKVLIFVIVALFLKSCISITDIGCIIDFGISGLLFLSIFFTLPAWLLVVGAILIGIKGVRSFGI